MAKWLFMFMFVLLVAACGGNSSETQQIVAMCQTETDCSCPEGEAQACLESGVCACTKTVQSLQCEQDAQCAEVCEAEGADGFECSQRACVCTKIETAVEVECYTPTKGQIAQWIFEARGDRIQQDLGQAFPDVNHTHPNFQAITQLHSWGLIQGNPDGKFGADQPLTRAEFAKIVVPALNGYQLEGNSFQLPTDIEVDSWYHDPVNILLSLGVEPYDDGLFRPAELASSCFIKEAISILSREGRFDSLRVVSLSRNTVFSDDDLQTVPAGSKSVTLFRLSITSTVPGRLQELQFWLYTNAGEGSFTPISDIIERPSLVDSNGIVLLRGEILEDSNALDSGRRASVIFKNIGELIHPNTSTRFTLTADVKETSPQATFTSSIQPCNDAGYEGFVFLDGEGVPLKGHPIAYGCPVLNDIQLTVRNLF